MKEAYNSWIKAYINRVAILKEAYVSVVGTHTSSQFCANTRKGVCLWGVILDETFMIGILIIEVPIYQLGSDTTSLRGL